MSFYKDHVTQWTERYTRHLDRWVEDPLDNPARDCNAQVTPPVPPTPELPFETETKGGRKYVSRKEFLAKVRQAMAGGAQKKGPIYEWDLTAGSKYPCEKPIEVFSLVGRHKGQTKEIYDNYRTKVFDGDFAIGVINYYARCRKCAQCNTFREKEWIARTLLEVNKARSDGQRVWFVTLTCNYRQRRYIDAKSMGLCHIDSKNWYALNPAEKYHYRAKVMKEEISLYLKRVRKGVGKLHNPKIRFVAVTEPHKDYAVHAHLLILETRGGDKVTEDLLRKRWRGTGRGFCQANIVKDKRKATWYVAKYLGKELSTVQASVRFGKPSSRPNDQRGSVGKRAPSKTRKNLQFSLEKEKLPFFFLFWIILVQSSPEQPCVARKTGPPRRASF